MMTFSLMFLCLFIIFLSVADTLPPLFTVTVSDGLLSDFGVAPYPVTFTFTSDSPLQDYVSEDCLDLANCQDADINAVSKELFTVSCSPDYGEGIVSVSLSEGCVRDMYGRYNTEVDPGFVASSECWCFFFKYRKI
jgi:hypothetical protein